MRPFLSLTSVVLLKFAFVIFLVIFYTEIISLLSAAFCVTSSCLSNSSYRFIYLPDTAFVTALSPLFTVKEFPR